MQMKRMWSIDDLPEIPNNVTGANTGAFTLAGYNILRAGNAPRYWGDPDSTGIINKNGRKWLYGICNFSAPSMALGGLGLAWTGKVVIGYRVVTEAPGNTRAGSFSGANQSILYDLVMNGGSTNLNLLANTEYYVEAVLNCVDNTYRFYSNGTLIAQSVVQFSAGNIASIISTYNNFMFGAYNQAGVYWYMRDFNVREYTNAEVYTPLSNFEVQRAPLIVSSNAGYATSNGDTLNNVLNTDMTGPFVAATTPMAEAAGGPTTAPIVASLGAFPGVEGNILGLEIYNTMKSFGDAPAVLRPKLTQNGVDVNLAAQTLTGGYQYRRPSGIIQLAPDGSALTKAKIAATTLTLNTATS